MFLFALMHENPYQQPLPSASVSTLIFVVLLGLNSYIVHRYVEATRLDKNLFDGSRVAILMLYTSIICLCL